MRKRLRTVAYAPAPVPRAGRDAVDLERLVPVAGAHRRRLREAPRRVVGRRRVRVRELVPGLGHLPVDAAGRARQRDQRRSPGRASTPSSTRPATRLACGDGGPLGGEEPGDEPERQQRAPTSAAAARRARGRRRRAPPAAGRPSVSPVMANAQPITGTAPAVAPSSTTAPRRRSGIDANQNASPSEQRQQRAARVGQHQRHLEQRDPGPGQRADGGAARAARSRATAAAGCPSAAVSPTEFQ